MTEYVIYLHGANVRDPQYATRLDTAVRKKFKRKGLTTTSVYWGDVSESAERHVRKQWEASPLWPRMCFPEFRIDMLLKLIGDGALYISRAIGWQIIQRIYDAVAEPFRDRKPGDRLHIITHSWGAVIVLDMLFAGRWLEDGVPGRDEVLAMRNALFGMGENRDEGLLLASIVMMGSPMSLFSLMDGESGKQGPSSHDIAGAMQAYSQKRFEEIGSPLLWTNLIHPADAFAYPIVPLLNDLLHEQRDTVTAKDEFIKTSLTDAALRATFGRTDLAILGAAGAHNSYWDNGRVIHTICRHLDEAMRVKPAKSSG